MIDQIQTEFSQTFDPPNTADAGKPSFDQKAFAIWGAFVNFFGSLKTLVAELKIFIAQANALSSDINASVQSVSSSATAALAAANWKGSWNDIDDFAGSSFEYSGSIYISKIVPPAQQINDLPSSSNQNYIQFYTFEIDRFLQNIPVSTVRKANGRISQITYSTGHVVSFIRNSENRVSQEIYYDTDETTILSTMNYGYVDATWALISKDV